MKYLVETTGDFMLIDQSVGAEIPYDRPSIVTPTAFISAAAARAQLNILRTGIPAEAEDREFAEYWAENPEIALEAYLSKFGPEAEQDPQDPEPKPVAPKPRRKKAA